MSRKRYTVEQIIHKLRDELLNVEVFDSLFETKVLVEGWRREYNTLRPHSSLGYIPPTGGNWTSTVQLQYYVPTL